MITTFSNYLRYNRGLAEGTIKTYEENLRAFAAWAKVNVNSPRWSTITKQDIDRYVAALNQEGKEPATIKHHVSALRTLYKTMRELGRDIKNPAQYVRTPKLATRVPKTLEVADIRKTIYDKEIPENTRGIIAMLAEAGLRITEARTVTEEDIDREERSIIVRGKGNKERKVYYGELTAAYLEKHKEPGRKFQGEDREVRYAIHDAIRKHTTAEKCSAHIVRHTWATEMLNRGADIKTISFLMGHQSVKTTERYATVANRTAAAQYNQYRPAI